MATVKHTLDPKNPPKMSAADRARFEAIREEDIDYSDISELVVDVSATAEIKTPVKKPVVTMRIDEETIDYFKGNDPKGYTARMAAVLRAYVEAHQPK